VLAETPAMSKRSRAVVGVAENETVIACSHNQVALLTRAQTTCISNGHPTTLSTSRTEESIRTGGDCQRAQQLLPSALSCLDSVDE
jgi:flagellar biogenesis protein FliO